MKINMIVAVEQNNGIGNNNKLPWKFTKDMQFFKKTTIGNKNNAVVMGRKTYESIGKPLPNRANIVISKKMTEFKNDIICFSDPDEIFKLKHFDEIWIIGGSQLYNYFLKKSDLLHAIYITHIEEKYKCDAFFPKLPNGFKLTESKVVTDNNINKKVILNFNIYKSK